MGRNLCANFINLGPSFRIKKRVMRKTKVLKTKLATAGTKEAAKLSPFWAKSLRPVIRKFLNSSDSM